jgi:hypothetical protein
MRTVIHALRTTLGELGARMGILNYIQPKPEFPSQLHALSFEARLSSENKHQYLPFVLC